MKTNTVSKGFYSKISECIHCKKPIEHSHLYECHICGKIVCTNCASYVATYNAAENKYIGQRVCKNCEMPGITLEEERRIIAAYWMKRINNNMIKSTI
ncbi:MAG: FYVE zinc finger domain-containing protein [Promethearchaeota archaeon]